MRFDLQEWKAFRGFIEQHNGANLAFGLVGVALEGK
jgi:hypothetical protein